MRLHENTDDFRDLIRITSKYVGLDPTTVEKDYWITHALYQLSNSDYMEYVVFKGGTSLTKCYEDLHRFSEACKSGDYRHTQFTYKSIYSGNLRELHPSVRFELTSFMRPHPHEKRLVGSFIEQYLNQNDMKDIIDEFGLGKFKLNVLCIERTVVEKLAS